MVSDMAAGMMEQGHTVSVVFCDEKKGEPFFSLPKEVKVYNLFHLPNEEEIKQSAFTKIAREVIRLFSREKAREINYRGLICLTPSLQKVIEETKPEVIVSFREPTGRLLLEKIKTTVPVISMLHNDPDEVFSSSPVGEREAIIKSKYIQVLRPSFISKAKKYLNYDCFIYVPNAVNISLAKSEQGRDKETYVITNVGRITGRTKRQHLLVEAFAKVASDFPNWEVHLWGDTYDKAYVAMVRGLIRKYGLERRIFMKGTTRDMDAVWDNTDIFAFPSHHEGFGLALAEALGAGIPAVGYRSCPAVNELIHDNDNGFLVDDGVEPLAIALKMLMADASLRKRLGAGAIKSMELFRPDHVWAEWDRLIKMACKK